SAQGRRRAEGTRGHGGFGVARPVRSGTDVRPRRGDRRRPDRQGGEHTGASGAEKRAAAIAGKGPATALRRGAAVNLPVALLTIKWMVRDTFRQSLASRLFWVLLGVSIICIGFCLSVKVEGDERLPTLPGETAIGIPKNDPKAIELGPEGVKKSGVDIL